MVFEVDGGLVFLIVCFISSILVEESSGFCWGFDFFILINTLINSAYAFSS